jgi:hypothetical protein
MLEQYYHTKEFLGKVTIGDIMKVMPTQNSQSRAPYTVRIIEREINWVQGSYVELCTRGPKYDAVLNQDLLNRLKPI